MLYIYIIKIKFLFSQFDTLLVLHLFPNLIFQTCIIEVDKAQLSLLFLFVAWLALISSALWFCAVHVSEVLALEKKLPNDLLGNNEAISWLRVEKLCCPPPLSAGLCPLWEVRNLARCAKCLWSIITERVLDLACLPPHLVACCLKHILLYN